MQERVSIMIHGCMMWIISIFHGCKVWIEKSVTRDHCSASLGKPRDAEQ